MKATNVLEKIGTRRGELDKELDDLSKRRKQFTYDRLSGDSEAQNSIDEADAGIAKIQDELKDLESAEEIAIKEREKAEKAQATRARNAAERQVSRLSRERLKIAEEIDEHIHRTVELLGVYRRSAQETETILHGLGNEGCKIYSDWNQRARFFLLAAFSPFALTLSFDRIRNIERPRYASFAALDQRVSGPYIKDDDGAEDEAAQTPDEQRKDDDE